MSRFRVSRSISARIPSITARVTNPPSIKAGAQQRWTTAAPLLRDGYEGLVHNASVAQDREDVADAGDLVVKAYAQWGKQPAETTEWKQRIAADRVSLATLKP
jgi:hypothetical protein